MHPFDVQSLPMQEVMTDPVLCADGHSYERAAIKAWLRGHDTSPMTGEPLPNRDVVPNHTLRSMIRVGTLGCSL